MDPLRSRQQLLQQHLFTTAYSTTYSVNGCDRRDRRKRRDRRDRRGCRELSERSERRSRRRLNLRMCLRSILHVLHSYSYISQLILLPIGGGEYFPYLGQEVPTVA